MIPETNVRYQLVPVRVTGKPMDPPHPPAVSAEWKFLTNHAHVLLCVARDPETRLRDIAEQVGITERAVHRILSELESRGYVKKEKLGRRNRYKVMAKMPLKYRLQSHHLTLATLLAMVLDLV